MTNTTCKGEKNTVYTGCVFKSLMTDKAIALQNYKETKAAYKANMNSENWVRFCEAKTTCRLLGVRI